MVTMKLCGCNDVVSHMLWLQGSCVAVMTSVLRQMNELHYTKYLSHFETSTDLIDFLMEILMVLENLVKNNVYPVDWNEMIMLQNWSVPHIYSIVELV